MSTYIFTLAIILIINLLGAVDRLYHQRTEVKLKHTTYDAVFNLGLLLWGVYLLAQPTP